MDFNSTGGALRSPRAAYKLDIYIILSYSRTVYYFILFLFLSFPVTCRKLSSKLTSIFIITFIRVVFGGKIPRQQANIRALKYTSRRATILLSSTLYKIWKLLKQLCDCFCTINYERCAIILDFKSFKFITLSKKKDK